MIMSTCPNCGCDPKKEPYYMEATHCPKCGYIFKKTYKITYRETLIHTFEVEASSPEEAKAVFEEKVAYGEFDFSDGEIDETEFKIEEDN